MDFIIELGSGFYYSWASGKTTIMFLFFLIYLMGPPRIKYIHFFFVVVVVVIVINDYIDVMVLYSSLLKWGF